jgi:hypothetical protein
MKKFIATGEMEGKTFILNDRYSFVDGEMPASDDDAAKIKPILCGYHACELVDVAEPVIEDPAGETSLSKTVTQGDTESEE